MPVVQLLQQVLIEELLQEAAWPVRMRIGQTLRQAALSVGPLSEEEDEALSVWLATTLVQLQPGMVFPRRTQTRAASPR